MPQKSDMFDLTEKNTRHKKSKIVKKKQRH